MCTVIQLCPDFKCLCENERIGHAALHEQILAVGLLTAHTNTHAKRMAVCVKDYDRSSYFYPCHHRGIERERPQERTYCRVPEQGETEWVWGIMEIEGIAIGESNSELRPEVCE